MDLIKHKNYFISISRQGNDIDGNGIYLINVFKKINNDYLRNINIELNQKTDKYNNIRKKGYKDIIVQSLKKDINKL